MISDFAENLFFTRAAVEADSALANVRIEGPAAGPFGRARMPQKRDAPDSGTLTLAGLFRVWDDPASSRPCRRCGARRLFLHASAGGGAVSVAANGHGELQSLKLDPEFLKEDAAVVSETVLNAVREVVAKAKAAQEAEMGKLTGGFNFPGLM